MIKTPFINDDGLGCIDKATCDCSWREEFRALFASKSWNPWMMAIANRKSVNQFMCSRICDRRGRHRRLVQLWLDITISMRYALCACFPNS